MSSIQNEKTIVERLGGETDFKFIVSALVDRLQEDRRLSKYFGKEQFDTNDLTSLQEEFLKACFVNGAVKKSKKNKAEDSPEPAAETPKSEKKSEKKKKKRKSKGGD